MYDKGKKCLKESRFCIFSKRAEHVHPCKLEENLSQWKNVATESETKKPFSVHVGMTSLLNTHKIARNLISNKQSCFAI